MKIYLLKASKDYIMDNTIAFFKDKKYVAISTKNPYRIFTFDEDNDIHFLNLRELLDKKEFEIIEEKTYKEILDIDWILRNG